MLKNTSNDAKTSFGIFQSEKEKRGYDIKNVKEYNRLKVPVVLQAGNCTFEDIKIHAKVRQRLKDGTIERNLRYLRFMEMHPCPVDFRNPNYENFIRHMDYREQIEGKGWGALKHEWQAMMMYLRAVGINPREWQYRPPPRAKYTTRKIPTPQQVYQISKIQYHKDKEKNACIKYPVIHSFLIGWRIPSELTIAKITDVDLDQKSMKIISPKLYNATRYIDITEIAKPIKEWIEKWRAKIETQYSNDALYLHFDGRPFGNAEQLRKFLNTYATPKIKQVFPEYYNYLTRHWCAVAKLIKTKVETNYYDVYDVKEWLGHTKIETTMGYVQEAKFYYKKYPYDWIKRVLRYYNDEIIGENTLNTLKMGDTEALLFQSETTEVCGIAHAVCRQRTSFFYFLNNNFLKNKYYGNTGKARILYNPPFLLFPMGFAMLQGETVICFSISGSYLPIPIFFNLTVSSSSSFNIRVTREKWYGILSASHPSYFCLLPSFSLVTWGDKFWVPSCLSFKVSPI